VRDCPIHFALGLVASRGTSFVSLDGNGTLGEGPLSAFYLPAGGDGSLSHSRKWRFSNGPLISPLTAKVQFVEVAIWQVTQVDELHAPLNLVLDMEKVSPPSQDSTLRVIPTIVSIA
jgi:hypothetical protein